MELSTILLVMLFFIFNLIAIISVAVSDAHNKNKHKPQNHNYYDSVASIIIDINYSTATILNYIYKGQIQYSAVGISYHDFVEFILPGHVHPDDKTVTDLSSSLMYMLELYNNGVREYSYEFRILQKNGSYYRHRATTSLSKSEGSLIAAITVQKL